jgi:hypothetical protein
VEPWGWAVHAGRLLRVAEPLKGTCVEASEGRGSMGSVNSRSLGPIPPPGVDVVGKGLRRAGCWGTRELGHRCPPAEDHRSIWAGDRVLKHSFCGWETQTSSLSCLELLPDFRGTTQHNDIVLPNYLVE